MSSETSAEPKSGKASRSAAGEEHPDKVYLVSYPKIVFLYPTFFAALLAGIALGFLADGRPDPESHIQSGITLAFLGVLGMNLVVLGFDFPRTTSLTLFFVIASAVLGLVLLFTFYPDLLPGTLEVLETLRPVANPTFFYVVAAMLGLIYLVVLISVQFDYWEVRPNELLHHHGVLSDFKRFPAPNIRVEKEVVDVFEYLLLGSGRLILTMRDAERPIVLENVLFISKKEKSLTRMLSALHVQVRKD